MLATFFRRKSEPPRPVSNELPADLVAAIEACSVVERHPGEDGDPRIVVQLDGLAAGWIHSEAASRKALLTRWPDLSEEQLARAMRFLNSSVKNHLRAAQPRRPRSNWVHAFRYED